MVIPTTSRNTENATGLEDKLMGSAALRYRSKRLRGEVKAKDIDQEVLS